ncbi:MAG TPA: type VI secretion system tip protein TssI/VgrG [Ideonella sp.]|nr:type VI secretion system tip protein TssI/VgrG [Ideonella sp.]
MPTSEADFVSPLGEGALLFRRLQATEKLGRLPEYRVELLRPRKDPAIQPDRLLGKSAGVKLLMADDSLRHINGWVTRFEQGGTTGRFDIYRVELRPWLWFLTLGADCRIFQNKTAVEILDAVFADYSSHQLEKKLSGSFRARAFCVQYRESDFDFVSRLMEEEGIYYYFKHAEGQHTLVLTNGAQGHTAIPGAKLAWAAVQTDDQLREDIVTDWNRAQQMRSLKYTHTDYDAEAPTVDLASEAQRTAPYPQPGDLEVFDYPGGYDDLAQTGNTGGKKTEGGRLAQLRVDAFEAGHVVATGVTPFRASAAGLTFTFEDHANAGDYLFTSVAYEMESGAHEASGSDEAVSGFSCRFEAVPKAIAFQPQPVTPRPTIHGPQTATVVGPAGDEIHTDVHGRVKLQFRWDRIGRKNETSSCWVRVSHPWASKQFGMIALPRIGDEVVVEFLEGNPDRPLVTGRVYNGDNKPPYPLPAQATVSGIKTQSSKGGSLSTANELRMDDKKGSEYVWFQAEKNFHRWVKNDAFDTVKNDAWVDITKNLAHKIGENVTTAIGKKLTLKVGEDTQVKLGADFHIAVVGQLNLKVDDAVQLKAAQALKLAVGQGLDIDAGAAVKLTSGNALHLKASAGVVIDGGTQLTIKAGGAFITLGSEGVTISGTMVKINSGGSAGSANAAAQASPAAPQDPAEPTANQDPMT